MTDLSFLSLESAPLNTAHRSFVQQTSPDRYFQVAYALLSLLISDSLNPRRRILALFVLLESSKLMEGVFFSAVEEVIGAKGSPAEFALIEMWKTSRDAGSHTPDQILMMRGKPGPGKVSLGAVRSTVRLRESDELATGAYECEFLRPMPQFADIDCIWLSPCLSPSPIFDSEWLEVERCKEMLHHATEEQVTLQQESELTASLSREPHLAPLVLSPPALNRLVQRNKTLALDVLRALAAAPCFTSLLVSLCSECRSSEAIEVLGELLTGVKVPPEVVAVFVSAHIAYAKDIKTEPLLKSFVKKLSLFIERLVRERLLISELREEVLTFASDYSRIKEASALYRLVCDTELYE